MLRIEGVAHQYKATAALTSVDLTITPGVTGLVGVNGAGKSTLLTAAAGGRRPTRGTISIDGLDLYARRTRRQALGKVALMPQSATFPAAMTALEVVEYVAWMRGISSRAARPAAQAALEQVMLGDRAGSKVKTLSGGMQRRVCLAQAIVARPEVLLLDEPSTGLDPEQRRLMVQLLGTLDGTVLLSSHVMEDISDIADRVVVLDAGTVLFDGATEGLKARSSEPDPARAAESGFLSLLAEHRSVR